jgi:FKBP-type peptidyl-prolyl cis-trans isomerase
MMKIKMIRIIPFFVFIVSVLFFFSCKENSLEKQRQNELRKLGEFMRAHYPGVSPKPSGLYYFEIEPGTGDSIKIGDRVQIFHETMRLDSGYITHTGPYEPLELIVYPASQLSTSATSISNIRALHEALTYMKKGSKALLIFDSQLGFGQMGVIGMVPSFTSVMMEVEVYKHFPQQPSQ